VIFFPLWPEPADKSNFLTRKKMQCPHCHTVLMIGTVMDRILLARRTCPKCGKEFLVENDVPRNPDSKKPSGSVGLTKAKKSNRAKSG